MENYSNPEQPWNWQATRKCAKFTSVKIFNCEGQSLPQRIRCKKYTSAGLLIEIRILVALLGRFVQYGFN
jgi:hypothetical protein